jgi:hypothetical protein
LGKHVARASRRFTAVLTQLGEPLGIDVPAEHPLTGGQQAVRKRTADQTDADQADRSRAVRRLKRRMSSDRTPYSITRSL